MIRNEELECFLLGFGLELPDEGLGRPIALTALWLAVKEKCGDCDVNEVLDALYNLNPDHAELRKFVPLDGKYQAVSFERRRRTEKWKDFFYGDSFRIKVLPPGRVRFQKLCAEMNVDDDSRFARMAIEEARKSVSENDNKPHPWVGAVVVKDGKVLSKAHRGEVPGNHAEFTALERNLSDVAVAGATVYVTLEPCTTRNRPKIPCADRLIERRIKRVVVGMLDPDDRIRGKGHRKLTNAGIEFSFFPHDLAMEVEELNRDFTRFCEQQMRNPSLPTTDEDQSSWPDVILECQWPSLVHESKIPGSHTVRKRPWMLRHGGPGAVYNVRVHKIDFGEYEARFPSPVRTLTDAASVYPIICWKSDGQVIDAHDLESLIHNPPSGCDVQQYAIKTDGNEGEEIPIGDFILEVEIPITISYDDKNGNRFKIEYLLHYDTYLEKGEMIRMGKIAKVAPK